MTRETPEPEPLASYLDGAVPAEVMNWLKLVDDRDQLMQRIGERVGFSVEPGRDRLTKHELAMIATYVLAMEGEL